MKVELENIHHSISKRKYTELELEEGEYVVLELKRSKIGLRLIWILASVVVALIIAAIIFILLREDLLGHGAISGSIRIILLLALMAACVFCFAFAYVLSFVYKKNHMYITNRRAIQYIVNSPFSHSKNIIELSSIEDASYKTDGLLQYMFKFGTLRLATIGDETTYTFPFLDTPTDELSTISHLIHQEKERKKL